MGQLGTKTIVKLQQYAASHFNPVRMGFSPDNQVRIMIAEQMFQAYATGRIPRERHPKKVVGLIAEQVYRSILTTAQTDPHMAELRDAVGIAEDARGKIIPRTYFQLANDIEAYNVLQGAWGTDTSHHAKALFEEKAYELIEMGSRNSDAKALAAGMDRLKAVHNDFQEAAEDRAATAATDRDFITDVQLVRADAENFSRDKIEELKKKYGGYTDANVEELLQQADGTYAPDPGEADPTDDEDYFERVEREQHAGE